MRSIFKLLLRRCKHPVHAEFIQQLKTRSDFFRPSLNYVSKMQDLAAGVLVGGPLRKPASVRVAVADLAREGSRSLAVGAVLGGVAEVFPRLDGLRRFSAQVAD